MQLYRADDPLFTRLVLNSRDAFTEYLSFDKNLYAHRTNNYALAQRYGHMFQTTDVIQNRANEPAHVEQFLRLNPDTYSGAWPRHGGGAAKDCRQGDRRRRSSESERERERAQRAAAGRPAAAAAMSSRERAASAVFDILARVDSDGASAVWRHCAGRVRSDGVHCTGVAALQAHRWTRH
jgi:hypothetical protein